MTLPTLTLLAIGLVTLFALLPHSAHAGVLLFDAKPGAQCPAAGNTAVPFDSFNPPNEFAGIYYSSNCLPQYNTSGGVSSFIKASCAPNANDTNSLIVTVDRYSDDCQTKTSIVEGPFMVSASTGCGVGVNVNYPGTVLVWAGCGVAADQQPSIMQQNEHLQIVTEGASCPKGQTEKDSLGSLTKTAVWFVNSKSASDLKCDITAAAVDNYGLKVNMDQGGSLALCGHDKNDRVTFTFPPAKVCGTSTLGPDEVRAYQFSGTYTGLSGGAIAGIVIGVLAAVGLLVYAAYVKGWLLCCAHKKTDDESMLDNQVRCKT